MQVANHPLRCHCAQTDTSYPLAGEGVNSFVTRLVINTNVRAAHEIPGVPLRWEAIRQILFVFG
jgi:hypothetical protein